ncbi:hypothetical protein GCM10020331_009540 [Ectobacillus funiculus]
MERYSGLLFLSLINNSLNLLNVDPYWETMVIGAIILVAVTINTLGGKRRKKVLKPKGNYKKNA